MSRPGTWELAKDVVKGFIADEALSHGASIAYYTVFAMAPVLLIIIAIAGLVFGREAAELAIVGQLSALMGESTAKALEEIVHKVGDREGGIWATVIGVGALILTATGVFGEIQSALNVIWKAKDNKAKKSSSTLSRLARARAASLGLVVTSGFLITASLAASAALEALSGYLRGVFPGSLSESFRRLLDVENIIHNLKGQADVFAETGERRELVRSRPGVDRTHADAGA